jgi:hypothetical protein
MFVCDRCLYLVMFHFPLFCRSKQLDICTCVYWNFLLRARNLVAGSEKNHNKTKIFFLINWGKIYNFLKFCIEKSESDTVSLNLIQIFFKETETLLQVLRKKLDKKNLDRVALEIERTQYIFNFSFQI